MAVIGPEVSLHQAAYVHETAHLYGKVSVHENASIWINVVARAEHKEIVVGAYTNIQDFVMLHVGDQTPTIIGSHCSITHHCTIHGCTIGDNCLIGINSTIMDGCVIGDNSIVAGHTFLKEGTVIPPNSIVMGTPGKVVRTQNNYVRNRLNAYLYYKNALAFAQQNYRAWAAPGFPQEVMREMARLQAELEQVAAN
ncbi:gamma carbonic anhydrase family protein [Undibacterium sp.]|jgi:carbonic anhydrase/acetyltransferase-like protein (isoleucine patch superfamily)|uniref:gamma carbonic anhydrase family protein n=1 Tax=Undibacterium sp. TaxID=1914977 RepID=UPI002C21FBD2|nr:gamma carbonic anhydrase family protein [Undibacterium sp.]HTD06197.1 gamma carbonic anhydrase family protein [Undibacterium sp.]